MALKGIDWMLLLARDDGSRVLLRNGSVASCSVYLKEGLPAVESIVATCRASGLCLFIPQ